MINMVIEEALAELRAVIFEEIRETVEKSDGRVEISVELPSTIDEDRYRTLSLTAVFIDEDSEELMVKCYDDYYDCSESEPISLYSVDELLEIVRAL